jgi:hypothetical protein
MSKIADYATSTSEYVLRERDDIEYEMAEKIARAGGDDAAVDAAKDHAYGRCRELLKFSAERMGGVGGLLGSIVEDSECRVEAYIRKDSPTLAVRRTLDEVLDPRD